MKIFFVQFFCVSLPPLLNIFCFSMSTPFLSFIVPIFAWNVPLVALIFLKRSLVFPDILFSSISLHWSLRKAFLSQLNILWNSAFKWVYLSFSPLPLASLLFSVICKASSDNHFAFLHFFSLGMVLTTASCAKSQTSIHSSSGTLSDPLCVHFPLGHQFTPVFSIPVRPWDPLYDFFVNIFLFFLASLSFHCTSQQSPQSWRITSDCLLHSYTLGCQALLEK